MSGFSELMQFIFSLKRVIFILLLEQKVTKTWVVGYRSIDITRFFGFFDREGNDFSKEEVPATQAGLGGIFFTGQGTGLVNVCRHGPSHLDDPP